MSTVIRWYWAGAPWNRPYKVEVVEGTTEVAGCPLYATKAEAMAEGARA